MDRARAVEAVGSPTRLGIVIFVLMTLLAAMGAPAAGESATHATKPVFRLADLASGEPPPPVGSSTVVRTDDGLSLRLQTSGLPPSDVVTLWAIVFNDPEACEAGIPGMSRCGHDDAMNGRGGFSGIYAAGRVVDEGGMARYGGHLRVGDTASALAGPGLLNARGAEVVLVLKTHGQKLPGLVSEQLSTFAGGCTNQSDLPPGANPDLVGEPGPNDCAEIQISVHRPAE